MKEVITAICIASAITSIFVCRFRIEKHPKQIAAYFSFVFVIEWIGDALFIPKDAMGYEVAAVCALITGLFILALKIIIHLEKNPKFPPRQHTQEKP